MNKGFAEDLTEGKFSFPVVHAIRTNTSNRQVLSRGIHSDSVASVWLFEDVLQKRPSTPTTKRYVIDYMRDVTGSFEYTRNVLHSLDKQARQEVERLGGNTKLMALLDQMKVPDNWLWIVVHSISGWMTLQNHRATYSLVSLFITLLFHVNYLTINNTIISMLFWLLPSLGFSTTKLRRLRRRKITSF